MTNDEINKRIATEIMGICTTHLDKKHFGYCINCFQDAPEHAYPKYCNDDSPRRLLNEVEAKVIAEFGLEEYIHVLRDIILSEFVQKDTHYPPVKLAGMVDEADNLSVIATALQRAIALLVAWDER